MTPKQIREEKAQKKAYENRNRIKIGDKFLWRVTDPEYISSGKNRKQLVYSPSFPYESEGPLEVYEVYEGRNGYGMFVDYYLKVPNRDEAEYHIILNGPASMRMERIK